MENYKPPPADESLTIPLKMFLGSNKVIILSQSWRLIMGEKPSAILVTFLLINVPMSLANGFITTSNNFNSQDKDKVVFDIGRWLLLAGLTLQVFSSLLLFYASMKDPGIIPGTYVG